MRSRGIYDVDGGTLEHDGALQGPGHFEEQGKGKKERKRGKEKPFSFSFLYFSSTLRSPHSSSLTLHPHLSMEPMERKLMSSAAAGSIKGVTLLKDNPDLNVNCKDRNGR